MSVTAVFVSMRALCIESRPMHVILLIMAMDKNNVGTSLNVNLLSLNVRGLHKETKRKSVFQYIRKKHTDVCFLQETYSTNGIECQWKNQWGGDVYYSHGTNHSKGVMILIKPGLDMNVKNCIIDEKGRYILLDVNLQGENVLLLNVYAPNLEQEQIVFYNELILLLKQQSQVDHYCIVGGDMNIIRDPEIDRKGGNFKENAYYVSVMESVDKLLHENNLCDIWRIRNPDVKRYTWRQKKPSISSRLDMWYVSNILQDYCTDCDIKPSVRSDHSSITLSLKSIAASRGKGYWKLNNSFLEEEAYLNGIKQGYPEWLKESEVFDNKMMTWEYVKYKVRDFSVVYGKCKARKMVDNIEAKEKRLKEIDEAIDMQENCDVIDDLESEKADVEAELKSIDDYKTEGLILQSRCRWYEKGEKSNNYFLRLATRRKVQTTMNKLKDDNGVEVTDPSAILQMQANYYAQLYTDNVDKTGNEMEQYLNNIEMPEVDNVLKGKCEGVLTKAECKSALQAMKCKKSPGNDGLTIEFYKTFWELIGDLLVESLNMSYAIGKLTCSQRQAVIILLDKGKDRTLLKNWRPISLLNTDYKIASKAIAERLKMTLPHIIKMSQVGYIKGRNIVDNIRTVEDIMYYTKQENVAGILMSIDFEKAFDSCSWTFLELTMRKFNFGDSFIQWVKTFYNEATSCVSNNGYTSKYFKLERGVRQGDPLSPYLFLLVVEVLANAIRQDKKVEGICVSGKEIKLLQYADDTNGVVTDVKSAKRFLKIVNTFGTYSGLKLNKDKTEAMWLGKSANNKSTPLGISWPDKPMKILGVYCSYNEVECNKLNFEAKITKCKCILNEWKTRNLTMIGRVQILKTFIVSQFLFVASAIVIPVHYVNIINSMMIDYVWNGRRAKLSRSILYKTTENGGLGVPEFQTMISVSNIKWVKRYISYNAHYWNFFLEHYFIKCKLDIEILLQSNCDIKKLLSVHNKIPLFYVNLIHDWCHIVETTECRRNFIWYNREIKIDRQPVLFKEFYAIGIRYVHDIFDQHGRVKSFEAIVNMGLSRSRWLKWQGLVKAVKSYCKYANVRSPSKAKDDMNYYVMGKDVQKCTSKEIYASSLSNDTHVGRAEIYVEGSLFLDWKQIYSRPTRLIQDVKTREFQFRFLHDILINRYWLNKWKIVDNNACRWCEQGTEDILHIFWECKAAKGFWGQFVKQVKRKTDTATLTVFDVFFGNENELICSLVFKAKRYLYKCIYKEQLPVFSAYWIEIMYVKQIEKEIAIKSCKVEKWSSKWKPFL